MTVYSCLIDPLLPQQSSRSICCWLSSPGHRSCAQCADRCRGLEYPIRQVNEGV